MLGVGSPSPGSARRHLELQRGEEALRHRVVPAVALAAHALHRAGAGEQLAEALRRELDAAVGVEEELRTWLAPRQRAPQRFARQLCIEPVAHRRAGYLAGEQVEDDDEEDEPADDRQVRRVRDPGAVGRLSRAGGLEQGGRDRLPTRRVGRARDERASEALAAERGKRPAVFGTNPAPTLPSSSPRRKRVRSARSSLVSGPCGSRLRSRAACLTQARTAVSVRSSSRATCPMLLPLARTSPTTSALYSVVNFRRFRRSMDPVSITLEVSTNSGQAQIEASLGVSRPGKRPRRQQRLIGWRG